MTNPPPSALSLLASALERLGVPYFIGGSIASAARGVPRATVDVDLLARILPTQADKLSGILGPDWYADPWAIREAIAAGRHFNVIHNPSGQKFDLFPCVSEFHAEQLARAKPMDLRLPGGTVRCPVATAEDILLAKLQWYRLGGETSERQWRDILGIIAANPVFDSAYLSHWSRRLGVEDLLARAREELEREAG
jgi:hypothetical protein